MKNLSKLLVIVVFALVGLAIFLNRDVSKYNSVSAQTGNISPTPPANTNTNAAKTNVAPANTSVSNKTIPDEFVLGKDSVSEYGESPFNHKNHAFQNYKAANLIQNGH